MVIIVIGAREQGKSTYIRNVLLRNSQGKKIYAHDPNLEYSGVIKLGSSLFDFVSKTVSKRDSIIIFEEATIYFTSVKRSEQIIEILARSSKAHLNNDIIFVFHSLRSLPVWLLDMSNYLVIFKTNDRPQTFRTKFKDTKISDNEKKILNLKQFKKLIIKL